VVLKRLQDSNNLSNIPVIVLTARDPQANEDRSLAAGAAAFFQKPADNAELLEVIRASLPSASTGTQAMPS
jgi:DNA-binding response OmpR family regulator